MVLLKDSLNVSLYIRIKKVFMKEAAKKVKQFAEVKKLVSTAKKRGFTVVTTNGCFDLLHVGHTRYLRYARTLGDVLVVGVNSDQSVRRNKGAGRPIIPERERAELIASLEAVDYVFIFDDTTPHRFLRALIPAVHVKGGDRKLSDVVERDIVEEIGTRLVLAPYERNRSTTRLVGKIKKK